ncbi:molybdate ABC transporter substrate-binding protein [Candidatus Poriferisodalis sp.]|uniref:molybdate ABC transporter substrate-binding protein n=1 Tax=Candidatus Poriferisodalis sp. TaxID=3101277 RepID=UPI003B02DC6F
MGGFAIRRRQAAARIGAVLAVASVASVAILHLVSGCTTGDSDAAGQQDGEVLTGSLRILVAASLLPAAETLAAEFEQLHPGVEVLISGAGSSALREQVLAGAPADVFVPADPVHLETIRDDVGLMDDPIVVARNSLVLAVPSGNDAGVVSLADLSRPELLIGLCAAEVPCGAHARSGLSRAGIEPAPDTDEPNVRALVTKLAAGELDAAVVYASDAGIEAGIERLGWTAGAAPETTYEAAVLADAPNPGAAAAFVEFLLSATAWDAFEDHGFRAP